MFRILPQLKVYFAVPELERVHMEYDEEDGDIQCEVEAREDNGRAPLNVPGTPTETFRTRKNRSRSPSGNRNNMNHSASNVSLDSALRNDNNMSETDSESEWQDKATQL